MLAAAASMILIVLYRRGANAGGSVTGPLALAFFSLLCIRFCLWFLPRVLRSKAAAGHQQKLAWVELFYYAGMIVGLVVWRIIGLPASLVVALGVDALLQAVAAVLDFLSGRGDITVAGGRQTITEAQAEVPVLMGGVSWVRMAIAVVALTVGIQIVAMNLAHDLAGGRLAPYVLAVFYLGVAVAAIACGTAKATFGWPHDGPVAGRFARLAMHRFRFPYGIVVAAAGLGICMASVSTGRGWSVGLVLGCIIVAAFLYEVLALALLDRIGEEHATGVVWAYGFMAFFGAAVLWMLEAAGAGLPGNLATASICVVAAIAAVGR